eukprot:scaffold90061_cov66-Phaeocystis_antarctica.AAC.15
MALVSGFAVGSSPEDMRTAGRTVVATRDAVTAGAKKAEPAIAATSMASRWRVRSTEGCAVRCVRGVRRTNTNVLARFVGGTEKAE